MAPRTYPLWEYYKDYEKDYSFAACQVANCTMKISRGKSGSSKGKLAVTPLETHLKNNHPKQYRQYLDAKQRKNEAEKRKADEDEQEDEMENRSCTKLNSIAQRKKFFESPSVKDWLAGPQKSYQPLGTTYSLNDSRAKEKHRYI